MARLDLPVRAPQDTARVPQAAVLRTRLLGRRDQAAGVASALGAEQGPRGAAAPDSSSFTFVSADGFEDISPADDRTPLGGW